MRIHVVALAALALVTACDKDDPPAKAAPAPAASRPATPKPLQWRTDLPGAIAEAVANQRQVFVEFSAEWCVPCKEIEVKVFSVDAVQAALRNYVLVKLDVTDPSSEQDDIADKYEANTLPFMMVLDPVTDEVRGKIGTMTTPEELLAMLEKARP